MQLDSKAASEPEYKPRYKSWGDIYFSALGRGYDHGYAAYLADQWEYRLKKRTLLSSNKCGGAQ